MPSFRKNFDLGKVDMPGQEGEFILRRDSVRGRGLYCTVFIYNEMTLKVATKCRFGETNDYDNYLSLPGSLVD